MSPTWLNNFPFPSSDPLTLLSSLSGWPGQAGADFFDPRSFLPLSEYITANGGTVVSIPFLKTLRLEVSPGSPLPAKLREFGYTVRHAGTGTHLSPGNTPAEIFRAVDVVEITLPGNNTR